jgi:hypothetical protein
MNASALYRALKTAGVLAEPSARAGDVDLLLPTDLAPNLARLVVHGLLQRNHPLGTSRVDRLNQSRTISMVEGHE